MNNLSCFLLGVLCFVAHSSPAIASQPDSEINSTAIALASGNWDIVTSDANLVDVRQDPRFPIVELSEPLSSEAIVERLSDCNFLSLVVEPNFAGLLDKGGVSDGNEASRAKVYWLCPKLTSIGAEIVGKKGQIRITFKAEGSQRKMIERAQRRSINKAIVEGTSMAALTEPDFEIGPPLRSEGVLAGEPSTEELNAAALNYISAISDAASEGNFAGLDFLDFTKTSWSSKLSRQFQPISFTEVRDNVEPCKLSEGWPRRYDRKEKRVFAFDSTWRCLGHQGPYSITLFLEIEDSRVRGGRLIKKESIENRPPLLVPLSDNKEG